MEIEHESLARNRTAKRILVLDSVGALVAGAAVLALLPWLAPLHALPSSLLLTVGVVNLTYGTYSGALAIALARGRGISRPAIDVLIAGNLAWAVVCLAVVALHAGRAHISGLLHIGLEGAYVAILARLERRHVRPVARARRG